MAANPCASAQYPAFASRITSKERDSETGLDYFGARYYSGAEGRFISADPFIPQLECGNAGCFANYLESPQNWNRYAYTRNNPLIYIDPDGEKTELAVGRNTETNPFGHIALIIDGKVYSFGTNYNKIAGNEDWGADAKVYLDAQGNSRQTDLLELKISPDQEQSLVNTLDTNNPNAPGAAKYDALGNSCVTVIEKGLQNAGVLPTPQPGPEVIGNGGAVFQRAADKSFTPDQLADRAIQQPGLVSKATTVGKKSTSVVQSFINLFKKKTGSE